MSFKLTAQAIELKLGNPLRKMVLIQLCDQANSETNICWSSYEYIAEVCEMSRRTVITHIQWLEENGFLWIERRYNDKEKKNFSNKYHLTLDKGKQVEKPKCKSCTSENHALVKMTANSGENAALGSANAAPKPIHESSNESINKNIYSEKPKKQKSDVVEKPSEISEQTWNDFLVVRKAKKAPLTQTAWKRTFNAMLQVQEKTGHSLQQILEYMISRNWSALEVDWYLNALAKNQNTQGNHNAINQPTYSQNHQQPVKSDAEIYRDKLMAEYDAFYGTASESTGGQGFSGNVYDLEKPV